MISQFRENGPVVIGGVGGSGTRIVAELMSTLGFYIGNDKNDALDNLWFTLLFKRPQWYAGATEEEKNAGLGFFSKVMLRDAMPSFSEIKFALRAIVAMSVTGHNHFGAGRGLWPMVRGWNMLKSQRERLSTYIGWGWKEPNTHIFLDDLARYFGNFKYIFLMRHGLDMAFSKNQQQVFNWGWLFDVEKPSSPAEVPALSLKYWIQANLRVLDIGNRLGPHKFLVINYEDLCLCPVVEIGKILSFLNLEVAGAELEQISSIIKKPRSIGRYRDYDLGQFDQDDLGRLRKMGFAIET